jgi:putative ABC transport system ATP-binding protein
MIELRGIHKTFGRGTSAEVVALRDINLRIAAGEWVTVIGSNGAGKSTLLNLIAGVETPDAGAIEVDGREVTHLPEHTRAALVGRVHQNSRDGLAVSMTVEENLTLALLRARLHGLRRGVTARRRRVFVERLAEMGIGLEHRLRSPVGLLSGGQRQGLNLLMAILAEPRILLLDEHTANLDPATAHQIERLTQQVIEGHGLTALAVTHNMREALRLGGRTLVMHAGEVVLDIYGEGRRGLTADDLIARFSSIQNVPAIGQ